MNPSDSYSTARKMFDNLWSLNFEGFKQLFAENATVAYSYNGDDTRISLEDFLERMYKGHFTNINSLTVMKESIEKTPSNVVLCSYKIESDRKGNGRDESGPSGGPGKYIHKGAGGITVNNGLITYFSFAFLKEKV